ncbi:hypothetical protein [Streptomyces sp. NPDC089919]|uniref:hypothetical protein n=1 Tax=Streptomyces sp. NPDC089919 TaxID=3155188 RepID=UPI00344716AD
MGNNQASSGNTMADRIRRVDERLKQKLIPAEQADAEIQRIIKEYQDGRLFYEPEDDGDLGARLEEATELLTETLSLEASFNDRIRSREAELAARMLNTDPKEVSNDLVGWATRTEKIPGGVADVFDALATHRSKLELPKDYPGGCYASTYALVETLNGRPTVPSFGRDTVPKEFGPEARTARLGEPLLSDVPLKKVLRVISQAQPGTVFELRGGNSESGHVIVAVAPKSFLDLENGVSGEHAIKTMIGLGKTDFSLWYSGKLGDDVDL